MIRSLLFIGLLALGISGARAEYLRVLPGGCGSDTQESTTPAMTVDSTGRQCGQSTDGSTPGTGISPPTGGTGIQGWLSGIFSKLGSPFQAGGNIGNAAFGVAAGGNTAAVKAANTSPSTTDPGLVVLESPNGPGTFNGALTNPSGSTMTLGSAITAYAAGQLVAGSSTATASASWALNAATITVGSCPSGASAGATIYDTTAAKPIGQFASCAGTTLTLQAGALAASSGSTDALVLVNNPSFSILNSGASIQRVRISSNDTTSTAWHGQGVQIDLWTAAPTWTNGDRGTWLPATGAGFHLGSYTCTFGATWGDGVACEAAAAAGSATFPKLASGSTIYWSLQATTGSGVTGASKAFTLVPEIVN